MSFGMAFEDWIRTWLAGRAYRRSFRALRLEGDEDVLELGVGGGQAARVLLSRLDKGGTYTGFDVDLWWFERAKSNLRRFPNVTLAHGDIRTLPIEDEAFDVVVIHITLHDIPEVDREPIVTALAGKLRKGGVLFIKEPIKGDHGMPEQEIWRLIEGAGLQPTQRLEGRSIFLGPMVEGHFRK